MRRLIAASCAVAAAGVIGLAAGGAPTHLAKAGDAGSPGNKGLCNAYAHNSDQGKSHGQSFVRLAETAGDYNGDGQRNADDVTQYCADNVPAVGQPG